MRVYVSFTIHSVVAGQVVQGEAPSKWPLGGSVKCPGGPPRSLHTHTLYTGTIWKCVCVSIGDGGVVTLLMGPYGHKTNTNCSLSAACLR